MGYRRDNINTVKFPEQKIILNMEAHNNCLETWGKIWFQWKEGEYLLTKFSVTTSLTDRCMIIRNISIQIHKKLRSNIHGVLNKVVGNGWRDNLAYSRYFLMYLQLLSKWGLHPVLLHFETVLAYDHSLFLFCTAVCYKRLVISLWR